MAPFIAKRLTLFRWSGWFSLGNGVLATLFALRYLTYVPLSGVEEKAYAAVALPAQLGGFALVPILALWLLTLLLPYRSLIIAAAFTIFTAGQLLLLLDTEVFAQYRFHLSGFILSLLVNAGSDVFAFSGVVLLWGGLITAGMLAAQAVLAGLCWNLSRKGRWGLGPIAAALLLVMQLGMHTWHAWGFAHYDPTVSSLDRVLPLYYPLTADKFLQRRGWVNLSTNRNERSESLAQLHRQISLNYPRSDLHCSLPQGSQRLNVLWIAIDTWRADTLTDAASPNLARFRGAPSVLNFVNHLSGGNSTRTGIFSLFYGLPATYWEAFAATQSPPVFIEELQRAGYSVEALGSAALSNPEFDRTVFSSVSNLRVATPGKEAWDKDARITDDFLQFVEEQRPDQPFFGFLFYNAVHSYSVPPGFPKPFLPYWEHVNNLALGPKFDPAPYFNRYKTAVLFVDGLIGKVLSEIEARKLLENTVILVTSDHGEEFNDNGLNFWGHGSNYTDAQVHVPMLLYWPGHAGGRVDRYTSHLDVVPTFMQALLGCRAPVADYAVGQSLLSGKSASWIPIASYYDYGIRIGDHIIQVHPAGEYVVLDAHQRPDSAFKLDAATSGEIIDALSRFYR